MADNGSSLFSPKSFAILQRAGINAGMSDALMSDVECWANANLRLRID
jgi:hypothetical protein